MATTFTEKSFGSVISNTVSDVYTSNSSSSVFTMLQLTNQTGSAATATVYFYSNTTASSYPLVFNMSIPGNSTVGIMDGRLILSQNDKIKASASTANTIVMVGSVAEKTVV